MGSWVLRNECSGGYWHPEALQGTTLNHPELAYRFPSRDEAERVAAERNGTLIHGGEAVFDNGWIAVEVLDGD
jgi:hypothetical protein